jgi:hypothetical protein
LTNAETPQLDWGAIDPLIFDGRIVEGMIAIRKVTRDGIREAIDCYSERYRLLRDSRPEKFKVPHEGYWDGFYS